MSGLENSDALSTVEINAIAPSATGSHVTVDVTGATTSPPRKKARKNTGKRNTNTLIFSAVFLDPLNLRVLSSNSTKQPIADPADPNSLLRPLSF
jgi:hypothetical protein